MSKVMWSFKTKHFIVEWTTTPDVLDTSYMDQELAKDCKANVHSGKWKCFSSNVQVRVKGSNQLLASVYLGNSIYEKPAEFRDHFGMNANGQGSYFSDMVREAVAEARKNLPALKAQAKRDFLQAQRVLELNVRTSSNRKKATAIS